MPVPRSGDPVQLAVCNIWPAVAIPQQPESKELSIGTQNNEECHVIPAQVSIKTADSKAELNIQHWSSDWTDTRSIYKIKSSWGGDLLQWTLDLTNLILTNPPFTGWLDNFQILFLTEFSLSEILIPRGQVKLRKTFNLPPSDSLIRSFTVVPRYGLVVIIITTFYKIYKHFTFSISGTVREQ